MLAISDKFFWFSKRFLICKDFNFSFFIKLFSIRNINLIELTKKINNTLKSFLKFFLFING